MREWRTRRSGTLGPVEWVVEPAALDWVAQRLEAFTAAQVTSLVPSGFEAYARVLHPATSSDPSGNPNGNPNGGDEQRWRWSEVATWSGERLGPSSSFDDIATRRRPDGQTQRWPGGVRRADVGPELAAELAGVLRPATGVGERCWFAVWEGYWWLYGGPAVFSTAPGSNDGHRDPDQLPVPLEVRDATRAGVPSRSYVLYSGPLDDAVALGDIEYQWRHHLDLPGVVDEVPDLWWPESRAWFVGADIDLYSTYVGGTQDTIDRLSHSPHLEVITVDPADHLA